MANNNLRGFNLRLDEKKDFFIQSITIEDSHPNQPFKTFEHTEFDIDVRHEGAYITRRSTLKGMLIPFRFIVRIDYVTTVPDPFEDEPEEKEEVEDFLKRASRTKAVPLGEFLAEGRQPEKNEEGKPFLDF